MQDKVYLTLIVFLIIVSIGIGYTFEHFESAPACSLYRPNYCAWLFSGAFAKYNGSIQYDLFPNSTMSIAETMLIRVDQFNQTKVAYSITYLVSSATYGRNFTRQQWLDIGEPTANLVCFHPGPQLKSSAVLVHRNEIPAISYSCFNAGNEYGTVTIGTRVPFLLRETDFCSVCSGQPRLELTIDSTNIRGLLGDDE